MWMAFEITPQAVQGCGRSGGLIWPRSTGIHDSLYSCTAESSRPYVYPVHAHDLAALHDVIAQALAHPIDRFIPEYMRFDHVVEQVMQIVEWDWQEEARIARAELGL